MNNFIVGLTNIAPTPNAALSVPYTLCGQWPGVALTGQTMRVTCTPGLSPARYVIIKTGATELLVFCEVQVFTASQFLPGD